MCGGRKSIGQDPNAGGKFSNNVILHKLFCNNKDTKFSLWGNILSCQRKLLVSHILSVTALWVCIGESCSPAAEGALVEILCLKYFSVCGQWERGRSEDGSRSRGEMKIDGWTALTRSDRLPYHRTPLCVFDQVLVLLNFAPVTEHDFKHTREIYWKEITFFSAPIAQDDDSSDLKSYAFSCQPEDAKKDESERREKVHNQITLDWLFVIFSEAVTFEVFESRIHVACMLVFRELSLGEFTQQTQ